MDSFLKYAGELCALFVGRLAGAAALLFFGRYVIKFVLDLLKKSGLLERLDGSVKTFLYSFVRIGLYALLAISIIALLGVPMASIITVLASASVAVGLALQGALTNLCGGIVIIIFKPFRLGDFIEASGFKGTVSSVTLLYTILLTPDNRRVTIPNGSLMDAAITDYSSEKTLRLSIDLSCARDEDPERVLAILRNITAAEGRLLMEPAPNVQISAMTDSSMVCSIYAWVKTEQYWNVLYDLNLAATKALRDGAVHLPATTIRDEKAK